MAYFFGKKRPTHALFRANSMMHLTKHLDVLTVGSEEHVYYYKYTLKSND